MSTERSDYLVVGGGAVGSAAAWQLARAGRQVTLLERFQPGHAKGASHGASRIFRLGYPNRTYLELARAAERQWRELEELTASQLLTITGSVEHGSMDYLAPLAEQLSAAGLSDSEWLPATEATRRWPGFSFAGNVFYQPYSGRLHADRSVAALQRSAVAHGAVVRHETAATSIAVTGADSVEVRTEGVTYRARRLIVAAGSWTQQLLGDQLPLPRLRVTQEQPAHFAARIAEADWPAFGHVFEPGTADAELFYGGIYGLATPGEGIKVGFHGVGPEVAPDDRNYLPEAGQLARLVEYARRWLPGVDAEKFIPISCTYTSTVDANFVLDRYGPIVVGAGFSGHGFKHVPAVGQLLADLATGQRSTDPLFAFGSRRDPLPV